MPRLESVAAARNAVNLGPDYAEAYDNTGAGYGALHLWDAAIQADAAAVPLQPDFQLARNNLAWAQQQKQRESR
jgi:hypothetical protein